MAVGIRWSPVWRNVLLGLVAAVGVVWSCALEHPSDDPSVSVALVPDRAVVIAQTQQPFVATVEGTPYAPVVWEVAEGESGGRMSSTGVYTAPIREGIYHIEARSAGNRSSRAVAVVEVVSPPPVSVSIASPLTPIVTLPPDGRVGVVPSVMGTHDTSVRWSIDIGQLAPPKGSITVDGIYMAPPMAQIKPFLDVMQSVTVLVRATSIDDPGESDTIPIVIEEVSLPLTVTPTNVTVPIGGARTVALSHGATAVTTWSVNGRPGGDSVVGTISSLGGYRAPARRPNPSEVFVTNSAAGNVVSVALVPRFAVPSVLAMATCFEDCFPLVPSALVAADLNGDGRSDLVTASSGTGALWVRLSADASHFAAPYPVLPKARRTSARALAAGRVNAGDTPDLVSLDVGDAGVTLRAHAGVGDGTFVAPLLSGSLGVPNQAAVGFIDADAIEDVVMVDTISDNLTVFSGLGDGRFRVSQTLSDPDHLVRPVGVAVGDFDHEGGDDLAVITADAAVSVWLNTPAGVPQYTQTLVFQTGNEPVDIEPVDLDSDSDVDLAVILRGPTPGVSVLVNTIDETGAPFGSPSAVVAVDGVPVGVVSADFNHDGHADVAVVSHDPAIVSTFFGDGHGMLLPSETFAVGSEPVDIATGDFNGDGWEDLAVASQDDETITILRNRADGYGP